MDEAVPNQSSRHAVLMLLVVAVCVAVVAAIAVPAVSAAARQAKAATAGPAAATVYKCAPVTALAELLSDQTLTVTVRFDGYSLTYRATRSPRGFVRWSYPGSVEVAVGGKTWRMPRPADPGDEYWQLGGLCLMRPGAGGVPYVLAEGYWGGAHCCYGPTIYTWSAALRSYTVLLDLTKPGVGQGMHWNPNTGFSPEQVGGSLLLASSDGAFAYAFGCYACTPPPTRLFRLSARGLVDVTTRYPSLVRSEAEGAWNEAARALKSPDDASFVEGPLAEWAADKCELGQGRQMWRTLQELQAKGDLKAAEGQPTGPGQTFPAQLRKFLLGLGYCRGQLPVVQVSTTKTDRSTTKAAALPAVDECGWTGSSTTRLVRPKSLLVMCGDGNGGLVDLRWASWGSSTAFARAPCKRQHPQRRGRWPYLCQRRATGLALSGRQP